MYVCMYVCMYVYTRAPAHTHTHTHIGYVRACVDKVVVGYACIIIVVLCSTYCIYMSVKQFT